MAVRKSFLTVDQQLATAPGPSHYTPDLEDHVKGGDSLKSKAERFRDRLSRTPGPGTYSVSKRSDWLRKTYPPPSPGDQTAPSIPTPGQSYGYDETGDGDLTPQPLPPQDSTMGPAYYNVSHDDTVTTKKYRGVHFGNHNSLRTQFKDGDVSPPPSHPPPRTKATSSKSLPRYHMIITRQEEKKAVPGPGRYDIRSQFRTDPSADGTGQNEDEREEETEDAPFGSREKVSCLKQFTYIQYMYTYCLFIEVHRPQAPLPVLHHLPGASLCVLSGKTGTREGSVWTDLTSLQEKQKRQGNTWYLPHSYTYDAVNFIVRVSLYFTVIAIGVYVLCTSYILCVFGVGDLQVQGMYNNNHMTSLVVDLSRRSQFHGTYKCPFGSTSVRTAPLIKKDVILGPGPAHYQPSESQTVEPGDGGRSQQPRETKPSYTFASTTSRLYSPPSIVTVRTCTTTSTCPAIVTCSRVSIQDRAPSRVTKRSMRGAFLSSSSRSAPPRDIMLEEPDVMNPGPGQYDYQNPLGRGKPGLLCQRDLRFKPIGNKVPGPGAYTLSKGYKDTVLQGTYNATLDNPLTSSSSYQHGPERTTKKQTLVVET
ncbi:Sperm-tail PG-rich repeat-containing protein 2 [Geodia barretti]|nr:Sperm-tail PG-rich repeat-containing protein 2 [Geodia barretti]